jgi:hypothetical protein
MRDPKQWAKVPVCLKREIVAAMGGQNSELYVHFRKLAVEAYMILRKHASTFLTLLACMSGSAIECFSADSSSVSLEFAIAQVCSKISYGRFCFTYVPWYVPLSYTTGVISYLPSLVRISRTITTVISCTFCKTVAVHACADFRCTDSEFVTLLYSLAVSEVGVFGMWSPRACQRCSACVYPDGRKIQDGCQ